MIKDTSVQQRRLQAMHFIVEFIDVCHIISPLSSFALSPSEVYFIATLWARSLPGPEKLLSMRAQSGICITSLLRYFLSILVLRPFRPVARQQIEFE